VHVVRKTGCQTDKPCRCLGDEPKLVTTKPLKHAFFIVRADTFFARTLGLLGKRTIAPTQALWLRPCSGVHTFGLRCSIGVFFIDQQGDIVKTIAQLKPNRMAWCWRATSVVETVAFANEQTDAMKLALMRAFAQNQLP
jgi:uncharacterized membrane protein (UPF0127 family)